MKPKENVKYVLSEFKEHLPISCPELKDKKLQEFQKKMDDLAKNCDAHGFIDYLASNDLQEHIQSLKSVAVKKKPLSFQRFNLIVMPCFKYFESDSK